MSIAALIVDDEAPARRRIRSLLEGVPDFAIVGEARNGVEAMQLIEERRPAVVFLDIQMPEMDGFQVVRSIPPERLPLIVFVTAYDDYALDAFEVCALDYLLKPFDAERFAKALARVKEAVRGPGDELTGNLRKLLEKLARDKKAPARFMVKTRGKIVFVKSQEVDWIEAAGNYAELHVGDDTYLVRETLSGLESRLDPDQFIRVHRARIVNLERVREIHAWDHGDYLVVLQTGARLRMSRRYKGNLDRLTG